MRTHTKDNKKGLIFKESSFKENEHNEKCVDIAEATQDKNNDLPPNKQQKIFGMILYAIQAILMEY